MKTLGYSRMRFVGKNSLGYIYGKEYALEFLHPNFYERNVLGFSFYIKDMNGNGLLCPYSSVVTFLMNWEATKSAI